MLTVRASSFWAGACYDFSGTSGFALAANSCVRLSPGGICPLGPVCASWIYLSRSSTKRQYLYPIGDVNSSSVQGGNKMCARVALLILLVVAFGRSPLLEQPVSSLFMRYPRMVYVARQLRSLGVPLWRQTIQLGAFGAPTRKPLHLFSTNKKLLVDI